MTRLQTKCDQIECDQLQCETQPDTMQSDVWVRRGDRLKLAVLASVGSKIVSVSLQFLVIPLAIRALGAERYGVYAMLTSSLGWIPLAGACIAPGLTIAIAAVRGDYETEADYLTSALYIAAQYVPSY